MTSGESKDLIFEAGGCNAMCVSIFTNNAACTESLHRDLTVLHTHTHTNMASCIHPTHPPFDRSANPSCSVLDLTGGSWVYSKAGGSKGLEGAWWTPVPPSSYLEVDQQVYLEVHTRREALQIAPSPGPAQLPPSTTQEPQLVTVSNHNPQSRKDYTSSTISLIVVIA